MPTDGSIILEWSGKRRVFRLALGQIFRLQEATGLGPYDLATRVSGDDFRVSDISEIIRIGLIGGGTDVDEAYRLVDGIERTAPINEIAVARAVISAALIGPQDDKISFSGPSEPTDDNRIMASAVYGNGAVMGFSPVEIDQCSLWQYTAAAAGYRKAHGSGNDGVSAEEADDLWKGVQERMGG